MAEMLMDGLGSANYAAVDDTNRLWTTGSITSMPPVLITGSVFIGSVSAHVDSMYIQSGDNVNITGLPGDLGSVVISSSNLIGVSGAIFDSGDITGSFAPIGVGSTIIQSSALLGVSGAIFDSGDITGSMVISSAPLIGVSGLKLDDLAGSFAIINETTMQDVGSPCFKRGLLTASGTYSAGWLVGGVGSHLEMHGFHISTNNPGYVRLVTSGPDYRVISDWNLNFASGAAIEKTFVMPIVPGSRGASVGVGFDSAGSALVTVYGREVK